MTKTSQTPNETKSNTPATITAITGLITGIITAIGGLLLILHQVGVFPFSPTPTPTSTFTPTPRTADSAPTPTNAPTLTETHTPQPTFTPSPAPTVTLSAGCPWRPFSTRDSSLSVGKNCLNDLLSLGISGTDRILFYREKGLNIGVFGVSKNLDVGSKLNIRVEIKELRATRLLVLLSRQEQGYFASLGFRLIREGDKRLIQLVSYDSQGFEEVISDMPEPGIWEGKFTLTLNFNGPQVKAYANGAFFGQTQIEFVERYLFLGYQVMSGGADKPYIHVILDVP